MSTKLNWIIAVLLIALFSITLAGNSTTLKIKTSAECGTCKKAIEKAVKKLSGIESADLEVSTKLLTVKFDTDKINADEIRLAVSRAGYDADSVKAELRAYNKLPACCKKGGHK